MSTVRLLVIGGILAGIAVFFQTAPVFLTELFLPITVLSTFPVYFTSRINPRAGFCTFISAAFVIFLISPHEGFFFICTNGMLGLVLGICRYYTNRKLIITIITSLVLSSALCFVNFIIGIAVFGSDIPGPIWVRIILIWIFSVAYGFIFLAISNFLFKKLVKFI